MRRKEQEKDGTRESRIGEKGKLAYETPTVKAITVMLEKVIAESPAIDLDDPIKQNVDAKPGGDGGQDDSGYSYI
ncbi:MAG: hypothetical protein LBN29_02775 [Mediterranea sp.]|nr:hypothetical protein [Mediterranea sp.]